MAIYPGNWGWSRKSTNLLGVIRNWLWNDMIPPETLNITMGHHSEWELTEVKWWIVSWNKYFSWYKLSLDTNLVISSIPGCRGGIGKLGNWQNIHMVSLTYESRPLWLEGPHGVPRTDPCASLGIAKISAEINGLTAQGWWFYYISSCLEGTNSRQLMENNCVFTN